MADKTILETKTIRRLVVRNLNKRFEEEKEVHIQIVELSIFKHLV